MPSSYDSLLTFEIPERTLGAVLSLPSDSAGEKSFGQVVREILEKTDWKNIQPPRENKRQVSFRVGRQLKERLVTIAKTKGMSVGNLLRAAIDVQTEQPSSGMGNTKQRTNIMAKKVAKKVAKKAVKKVAKKVVKKAPVKKVAKKAVKKAPAKKAVKKAPAKKVAKKK